MYITIAAPKRPVVTLLKAYNNYTDVFNEEEAKLLPDYSVYKLVIKLIEGK